MKIDLEREVEDLKRAVEFLGREVGRPVVYSMERICFDARGNHDEQWFYSQFKLLLDYLGLKIIPNPKLQEKIPGHIIIKTGKTGAKDEGK